jgi:ABC-type uncharacterized transport system substrate-binding protein
MSTIKKILMILIVCIFATSTAGFAADKGIFKTTPKLKDGKKWRIGYYEGGEYIDYQVIFTATIKGLMQLGWIKQTDIPPQKGEQTTELWKWLSTDLKSKYVEFVKDAHYTAKWDDKLRVKTAEKILKRLSTKKDLDLMIAMGTWAGQDLANNKHSTNTLAFSVSDALGAGIIKSNEDSGYDHIHARVDPFRFERQIRTFHDVVGFNKLGVAYEDTVSGRSISGIDRIEKIAAERGFEIIGCYTKDDVPDKNIAEETCKQCFHNLAGKKAEAIYVTLQNGVNSNSIPELVEIVNSKGIPTFSQSGSHEVKWGFLMSLSQASYKYVGEFNAKTIAKVFNGTKPRQIPQIFEEPPKIAINIKTAEIIGYDPPVDVMLAADEIFQQVELPPTE